MGIAIGKASCFPGINSKKRTNTLYSDHVRLSRPKNAYKGINDHSFLSELTNLPEDALIYDIHCADEGGTKQFLKLWLLPKNQLSIFYQKLTL
jgi:hypothetical protein